MNYHYFFWFGWSFYAAAHDPLYHGRWKQAAEIKYQATEN